MALISVRLRPRRTSVSMDDDAVKMAQPSPSKAMSSMVSPSLDLTYSFSLSPHRGLKPSVQEQP